MEQTYLVEVPKWILGTLNNLYEIEKKLNVHGDPASVQRNVTRIKEAFEAEHLFYEDPMGEAFKETRTDLEASITGAGTDDLVVVEVIKPIVRYGDRALSKVVQKGIVIVRSKVETET